uniref:Uncharacterized protein n=1 Tax=Anopheles christyi TaxID=43041 RepID=A0A182KGX9_9DIPT
MRRCHRARFASDNGQRKLSGIIYVINGRSRHIVGKQNREPDGLAPFVLRGACPQCTLSEMNQIKKTLAHLQRNFPSEWNKLVQTYAG